MKRFLIATAALSLLAGASSGAVAQPYGHDHGPAMNHGPMGNHGWRKGGRIARNDWNRGQRVDYRQHHLRAPPRGYEWRRVDNNYVLAAAATGLIASILAAQN